MSRSTMFAFAFPKGLLAHRPPVCGMTIGARLMYFARPGSWTTTSARSYFSKRRSSYVYFFFGLFGSFFGFAGASGGAAPSSGMGPGTCSSARAAAGSCSGLSVSSTIASPNRLLLATLHEFLEAHVIDPDHLEPDPGDVPVGAAHPPTDPLHEDLVVFIDEVDRAFAAREGGDLPPVLDELDLHALPQRRVRLLRLDGDLLEHDAAPLGGALEGVGLYLEVEDAALVVPVRPAPGL